MLLGEGRPPTGRQCCLVHRANRAESEVSRWSLGSGKSSRINESRSSRGSEPPVKGCLLWGLTDRCVPGSM